MKSNFLAKIEIEFGKKRPMKLIKKGEEDENKTKSSSTNLKD